ncbi:MAG: hypothetical protein Q7R91_02495 [bacterium]|nr:hypothetical protein [bacterium]
MRSTTESCDPATDAAGNIIPNKWTNCRPQDHAASVASGVDDSPGIKATKAAVEIGKAAALAGGMVGAAAVQRPAKTNVTQTQTGASATGGSATNTNTSTNKNCAQSTGAAGNNASPTNCP